jgi:hypothetical protein
MLLRSSFQQGKFSRDMMFFHHSLGVVVRSKRTVRVISCRAAHNASAAASPLTADTTAAYRRGCFGANRRHRLLIDHVVRRH